MGVLSINPQLPLAVVVGVVFSATGLFAAAAPVFRRVERAPPQLRILTHGQRALRLPGGAGDHQTHEVGGKK